MVETTEFELVTEHPNRSQKAVSISFELLPDMIAPCDETLDLIYFGFESHLHLLANGADLMFGTDGMPVAACLLDFATSFERATITCLESGTSTLELACPSLNWNGLRLSRLDGGPRVELTSLSTGAVEVVPKDELLSAMLEFSATVRQHIIAACPGLSDHSDWGSWLRAAGVSRWWQQA